MLRTTLVLIAFFCWRGLAGTSLAAETEPAGPQAKPPDAYAAKRRQMVLTQLESRNITDPGVLEAMSEVPRHLFVPARETEHAYDDTALPITSGQTISQPYIVGLMTQLAGVSSEDTVLEIGTGSGYQAAVLCRLARKVYTIEIIKELAESARERLQQMACSNVVVRHGDGYQGWPEEAPFDAIIVTAAPDKVPEELTKQLKEGGKMVVPVGTDFQELFVLTKNQDGTLTQEHIIPVRFVPMVRGNNENE
ncbi:MAG: protein-L-isoaspartate(D-aspartate) O-methyltransferase [Candidatus Omnitrophica bacterium]|nr:protein-L-isoaspartate(D-aspartate) O-methyltransferase [Candidatus Omnitrophota bacterium]MDD5574014.1 protein-L-isoaspartate(D-aspartate) O-methyltransferase [Candidatus Omnitrophota bacterium]